MTDSLVEKIKYSLQDSIEQCICPKAAFDADGTLWPSDVGREFFQYQIEKDLLKDKIVNPRVQFEDIKKNKGKRQALIWLARILSGFSLEQVQEWVRQFLKNNPPQGFLFQKKIISWLQDKNVQIFVVSSSLKWILDPAVCVFNIPAENVIGVQTVVKNGTITDELVVPVPIQEDKVSALYQKTNGEPPLFSSGNTLSDHALLKSATTARLVVSTAKQQDTNYVSERKLLQIAKKNNWFYC